MPANSPNLVNTSSNIAPSDDSSSESSLLDFDVSSSSSETNSLIYDESELRDAGGNGFTSGAALMSKFTSVRALL